MRANTAIVLAVALVSVFALATSASATHPRPGSASPLRVVPLMPSYQGCQSPNTTHVLPIALPSCSPPVRASDILTIGTRGQGRASVKLTLFCVPPETEPPCTPNDGQEEQDVALELSASDVRCTKVTPGCSATGADYTGRLINEMSFRMTDHGNGDPVGIACTNGDGDPPCVTATSMDFLFGMVTNPGSCSPTASSAGSTCAFTTTLNAQVPGVVKELQRMTVATGNLSVTDLGEDGDPGVACPPICATGDETRFLEQGLFAP